MFRHLSFFITQTRSHKDRMRLCHRQVVHHLLAIYNFDSYHLSWRAIDTEIPAINKPT